MRDVIVLYHRGASITGIRCIGLQPSSEIDAQHREHAGQLIGPAHDLLHSLERYRSALPYYADRNSLEIEAKKDVSQPFVARMRRGLDANCWPSPVSGDRR